LGLGVIALRAMFGQDEANHGTTRYRVGPDGILFVPPLVAEHLLRRGGFAVVAASPASGGCRPVAGRTIDLTLDEDRR
jgi:hypothetical protein